MKVSGFKKDRISIERELSNKGRFGGQATFDTKTSSSTRYKNLVSNDFLFKVKDDCTVIGKIL